MKYPRCAKCNMAIIKWGDGRCVSKATNIHKAIWHHWQDCGYYKRMKTLQDKKAGV